LGGIHILRLIHPQIQLHAAEERAGPGTGAGYSQPAAVPDSAIAPKWVGDVPHKYPRWPVKLTPASLCGLALGVHEAQIGLTDSQ